MNIEILESVLEELRDNPPQEIIPSTMGEPLLYREFDRIIELCRRYGVRLNLTTNGTFPGRGAAAWGEAIVPVGADVKISINGMRPETQTGIMCGSSLEKVLANAREFLAVRDRHAAAGGNYCSVTFQVTYLEPNIGELPDLVRLATHMGVDRVKGHHVWTHFPELEPMSMRRDQESIRRFNAIVEQTRQAAQENRRADGRPVKLENLFPLSEQTTTDIAPGAECPFLGREAWINWQGQFDPCCAPDEQRKSLGHFGRVQDSGFMAIWQGPEYRRLCNDYAGRGLCRSCNMRHPPTGGVA